MEAGEEAALRTYRGVLLDFAALIPANTRRLLLEYLPEPQGGAYFPFISETSLDDVAANISEEDQADLVRSISDLQAGTGQSVVISSQAGGFGGLSAQARLARACELAPIDVIVTTVQSVYWDTFTDDTGIDVLTPNEFVSALLVTADGTHRIVRAVCSLADDLDIDPYELLDYLVDEGLDDLKREIDRNHLL